MYGENGIENGVIVSTRLGIEDHGILVLVIDLDFDGRGQGYVVTLSSANAYVAIRSILEALEVDFWEKLKGKACRVDRQDGLIRWIGHIYKDKWSKRAEE